MSYSFTVTAKTKEEAAAKIQGELALVVANQPNHEADRQAAQDAAAALINTLVEPRENEVICVTCHGSLSWHGDDGFYGANLTVNTSVTKAG